MAQEKSISICKKHRSKKQQNLFCHRLTFHRLFNETHTFITFYFHYIHKDIK